MKIPPVLDQVVIGYSPVYDRRHAAAAIRLTVFPLRADAAPDAAALLDAVAEAFQEAPQQATVLPGVLLNIAGEALLDAVLAAAQQEPRPMLIEVPAFIAAQRETQLRALRDVGQALALGGLMRCEISRNLQHSFRFATLDLQAPEQKAVIEAKGWLPFEVVAVGARLSTQIDAALAGAAAAVAGWPIDDEIVHAAPGSMPPEVGGIVELMNRIEREEPPERMESVLTADPALAFRLLRYLNSAAFGLRAEITSFRHALMMLGHARLRRWLALLLATGSRNPSARHLNAVAARRGLIMDELARSSGDEAMRAEMFISGVFSLLDRALGQPMEELMRSLPVQQRVQQSLVGGGPYSQHLALVQAIEQGSAPDIAEACERVLVGRGEVNRALLRALAMARELD